MTELFSLNRWEQPVTTKWVVIEDKSVCRDLPDSCNGCIMQSQYIFNIQKTYTLPTIKYRLQFAPSPSNPLFHKKEFNSQKRRLMYGILSSVASIPALPRKPTGFKRPCRFFGHTAVRVLDNCHRTALQICFMINLLFAFAQGASGTHTGVLISVPPPPPRSLPTPPHKRGDTSGGVCARMEDKRTSPRGCK